MKDLIITTNLTKRVTK